MLLKVSFVKRVDMVLVKEVKLMKGGGGKDLPGRGLGDEANEVPVQVKHQDEVPAQVGHQDEIPAQVRHHYEVPA